MYFGEHFVALLGNQVLQAIGGKLIDQAEGLPRGLAFVGRRRANPPPRLREANLSASDSVA